MYFNFPFLWKNNYICKTKNFRIMSDFTKNIEKTIKKYDYSNFEEIRITNVPKPIAERFEKVRQKKGISRSAFGKMIISEYLEKNYLDLK
jgi:hypothetical protein